MLVFCLVAILTNDQVSSQIISIGLQEGLQVLSIKGGQGCENGLQTTTQNTFTLR